MQRIESLLSSIVVHPDISDEVLAAAALEEYTLLADASSFAEEIMQCQPDEDILRRINGDP